MIGNYKKLWSGMKAETEDGLKVKKAEEIGTEWKEEGKKADIKKGGAET